MERILKIVVGPDYLEHGRVALQQLNAALETELLK
jgi:hypothetical protein